MEERPSSLSDWTVSIGVLGVRVRIQADKVENGQRDFWVTRATFLGGKAVREESGKSDGKSGGFQRRGGGGGRGGRGRGGRGGGRGRGGRGGNNGGRGRERQDRDGGAPANKIGLPPTVATN